MNHGGMKGWNTLFRGKVGKQNRTIIINEWWIISEWMHAHKIVLQTIWVSDWVNEVIHQCVNGWIRVV